MTERDPLLYRPEFPKSQKYDPQWMMDHQMGPNAVWLTEFLSEKLKLEPGMRVLDLACGKALSSIFLAKEFGVQVHAVDLWIGPDHNWTRAQEAGVDHLVCPVLAEAHALPFAQGYFDAIVSIDGYQYFGYDPLYLAYLGRFLKPGGQIGVLVPGFTNPIEGDTPPAHLTEPQSNGRVFWDDELWSFQTTKEWEKAWRRSSAVSDIEVDSLPDGWRHWRDFELAVDKAGKGLFPSDAEALDRDQGRHMGFVRLIAKRKEDPRPNYYQPKMCAEMGFDT